MGQTIGRTHGEHLKLKLVLAVAFCPTCNIIHDYIHRGKTLNCKVATAIRMHAFAEIVSNDGHKRLHVGKEEDFEQGMVTPNKKAP